MEPCTHPEHLATNSTCGPLAELVARLDRAQLNLALIDAGCWPTAPRWTDGHGGLMPVGWTPPAVVPYCRPMTTTAQALPYLATKLPGDRVSIDFNIPTDVLDADPYDIGVLADSTIRAALTDASLQSAGDGTIQVLEDSQAGRHVRAVVPVRSVARHPMTWHADGIDWIGGDQA